MEFGHRIRTGFVKLYGYKIGRVIRMCGITGWIDYKRSLEQERETVTKMAETLAKRGQMIQMYG